MKCEKCMENEANFYYKSTINGKTTEWHLCGNCAQEAGLMEAFYARRHSPFSGFLSDPFWMFGNMMNERMFPSFSRSFMMPMLMPWFEFRMIGTPPMDIEAEKPETKIPADAGEELKAKRELIALKNQLSEAVKAENFEKAIELRDKIRELEK